MLKHLELTSPTSCINKARDTEMLFVLLARDKAAAITIRFWVAQRVKLGLNTFTDPQIKEALDCARYMEQSAPASAVEVNKTSPGVEQNKIPSAQVTEQRLPSVGPGATLACAYDTACFNEAVGSVAGIPVCSEHWEQAIIAERKLRFLPYQSFCLYSQGCSNNPVGTIDGVPTCHCHWRAAITNSKPFTSSRVVRNPFPKTTEPKTMRIHSWDGSHDLVTEVPAACVLFTTGEDVHGPYIECGNCRLRSYSPADIEHQYCGNCKVFHKDRKTPAGATR